MFYIRLSIKTACFVDKVAKIGLLSIKMPFFLDRQGVWNNIFEE